MLKRRNLEGNRLNRIFSILNKNELYFFKIKENIEDMRLETLAKDFPASRAFSVIVSDSFYHQLTGTYQDHLSLECFVEAFPPRGTLQLQGNKEKGYFLAGPNDRDGYYDPIAQIEMVR